MQKQPFNAATVTCSLAELPDFWPCCVNRENGPKLTLDKVSLRCGAARQTGLSLQVQSRTCSELTLCESSSTQSGTKYHFASAARISDGRERLPAKNKRCWSVHKRRGPGANGEPANGANALPGIGDWISIGTVGRRADKALDRINCGAVRLVQAAPNLFPETAR